MAGLTRFWWPETSRRMLDSEGEYPVDEVSRHWVTRLVPALAVLAGMATLAAMPSAGALWWAALLVGLALGLWGLYRLHAEFMDRFVVTNMRVFRVHGVVNQHMATVPIVRILDISVEQPLLGQVLGYGHFVFESAAQDQGLKRIEFVPRIESRELTIQRVIQRAGIRARMAPGPDDFDGV